MELPDFYNSRIIEVLLCSQKLDFLGVHSAYLPHTLHTVYYRFYRSLLLQVGVVTPTLAELRKHSSRFRVYHIVQQAPVVEEMRGSRC